MAEVSDYTALITSEHADKPKFVALVETNVAVPVRVANLVASMPELFDVDTAVGQQLDMVGQWAGVSRNVNIPITGVYFTWDSVDAEGWDYGTWQPPNQPFAVTSLPDDAYRVLIKARIAANQWDGTTPGAYAIWDSVFTAFTILIQDHTDMSYDLAIVGGIIDSLTLALLTGGYIPLRPEGVLINEYFVPVNSGPLFGWDVDSDFITGWDSGSWAKEVSPT